MSRKGRTRCFFDIAIDGAAVGRVLFELHNERCPRTCENFRALCTGERGRSVVTGKALHYKGSTFHRIVKNFMVQGGDFTAGNGTGGESIYGGTFDDEDLGTKHEKGFLLSMANRGPGTNGSQFFITTRSAPHLDGRHVVYGHVIDGEQVVREIENQRTDTKTHRPYTDVTILNCGELLKKGKKKRSSSERSSASEAASEHEETAAAAAAAEEEPAAAATTGDNVQLPSVKEDEVPDVPSNKFLYRRSQTPPERRAEKALAALEAKAEEARKSSRRRRRSHKDDDKQEERSKKTSSDNTSSKPASNRVRVSKSGHKMRGRGMMRWRSPTPDEEEERRRRYGDDYRTRRRKSISPLRRSVTPPHWRREQRRSMKYTELLREREKQSPPPSIAATGVHNVLFFHLYFNNIHIIIIEIGHHENEQNGDGNEQPAAAAAHSSPTSRKRERKRSGDGERERHSRRRRHSSEADRHQERRRFTEDAQTTTTRGKRSRSRSVSAQCTATATAADAN